jgi:hypothetical protein
MEKELICSVLMSEPFAKIWSVEDDHLQRVAIRMQIIFMKYFKDPQVG